MTDEASRLFTVFALMNFVLCGANGHEISLRVCAVDGVRDSHAAPEAGLCLFLLKLVSNA